VTDRRIYGKRLFVIILLFILFNTVAAQEADTVKSAPSVVKSPRTAMLRSAFLPGWGQWYNNQKLKALIVFGGEAALIGNAVYYNQMAVSSSTYGDRKFYQDIRSQFLWWLVAVHLLNILDAYVDAHLFDFDTGPDLSSVDYGGRKYGIVACIPLSKIIYFFE
jgi:hypothetical protein